jgi:hypothetical protein
VLAAAAEWVPEPGVALAEVSTMGQAVARAAQVQAAAAAAERVEAVAISSPSTPTQRARQAVKGMISTTIFRFEPFWAR